MAKSITIPKTPKSAYDPKRKISSLLKAHIASLEAVTQRKLGVQPTKKPKTEAQASVYIAELTQYLHPPMHAAAPPSPVPVPPAAEANVPARRKKRAAATRRRKRTRAGAKK